LVPTAIELRHRVQNLFAERILYVVDAPQSLHLEMVWATARMGGWLPGDVRVVHVKIGNVLGPPRDPQDRSETSPRLKDLLDEAGSAADAAIAADRPAARTRSISRKAGGTMVDLVEVLRECREPTARLPAHRSGAGHVPLAAVQPRCGPSDTGDHPCLPVRRRTDRHVARLELPSGDQ
jgi:hypothetical protein